MIAHVLKMVRRNARSYLLLSVTVTLSFALLLGYLGYTDSSLYNRYKELFAKDRSQIHVWSETVNDPKFELLEKQTAQYAETAHYEELVVYPALWGRQAQSESGQTLPLPNVTVHCLPARCWTVYGGDYDPMTVTWLDGQSRENVSLRSGEMLMDARLLQLFGLEGEAEPSWELILFSGGKTAYRKSFRIVGTFLDETVPPVTEEALAVHGLDWAMSVFVPMADLYPEQLPDAVWIQCAHYVTGAPELIYAQAEALRFSDGGGGISDPIYSQQNRALTVKQAENRTKALVAVALLILLGINLYSAFSNALNDRKFEIGVKRALGASAFSILRQFLYESLLIMLANILLAVALVVDVFLVYKIVYERIPDDWGRFHTWIIYLSPYSVGMFAACAVSLLVSFSLIFSYQTTRVEIVQYLKAE